MNIKLKNLISLSYNCAKDVQWGDMGFFCGILRE